MEKIPLVDLKDLPSEVENVSSNPEWIKTAGKIREGLGTVGFLYLTNHGIPNDLVERIFTLGKDFFALPDEVKLKYKKDTSSASNDIYDFSKFCGYVPVRGELIHETSKVELHEAYDWLKGIGTYPTDEFPDFYSSFDLLDHECKQLTKRLLKLIAISLKLDDVDYFIKHCQHLDDPKNFQGIYNLKVAHYPPISDEEAVQPGTVRLGEHSDYGLITLLFQDDVGGLEVKTVDGNWIHAKPIPGTILINTGDLIEFWSGGIFPATPHRLTVPKDVEQRRKSRYSVVFFNGPDSKALVNPMDLKKTPVERERLQRMGKTYSSKPVVAAEYMLGRIAGQYKVINETNH